VLDEALALVEPADLLLNPVWQARAEAAWLSGDDSRAKVEAHRGLEPVTALSHHDPWVTGGLARWLRIARGVVPEVPAAEPFALELAEDWDGAAAAWDRLGCPYDAALARLGGDAPALHQALATFEALGAEPAAARTRARMRALGLSRQTRGPHLQTRANPHPAHPARTGGRPASPRRPVRRRDCRPPTRHHAASSHVSAILAKLDVWRGPLS